MIVRSRIEIWGFRRSDSALLLTNFLSTNFLSILRLIRCRLTLRFGALVSAPVSWNLDSFRDNFLSLRWFLLMTLEQSDKVLLMMTSLPVRLPVRCRQFSCRTRWYNLTKDLWSSGIWFVVCRQGLTTGQFGSDLEWPKNVLPFWLDRIALHFVASHNILASRRFLLYTKDSVGGEELRTDLIWPAFLTIKTAGWHLLTQFHSLNWFQRTAEYFPCKQVGKAWREMFL